MSNMSHSNDGGVSQRRRRKRMRTLARSTPWKDSFELNAVGSALLLAARLLVSPQDTTAEEKADLYHALCRVNMWKARSDQGRIPHSMETTFALAQVAWRDATSSSSNSSMDDLHPARPPSSIELRMAYAMAIMRGVNGLADALQQNRAYAASVSSLCEQMGLPGWIVDIRHEAAHNDLPSLPVLRLATRTFLGYLEERYWLPLANARQDARETAVYFLVKYKEVCKKCTVATVEEKPAIDTNGSTSESNSDGESELDDNDVSEWGKSLGTNKNRFAVFLEDTRKPKVVSRKKRKKEASKDEIEPNQNLDSKQTAHSALHYAKLFVRDVPIDVAYQVALSFLVWGGVGDTPIGRGALIPGSPASFPASVEGIQKIRDRYKPLILVLCNAWSGFTHALLVHLVDHVIAIEQAADSQLDAGSERKIYFLSSWCHFLLSREFLLHQDTSVGIYDKQDLSKKSGAQWTRAERDFMASPAPYSVLRCAGLPLNSLCDRCFDGIKSDHVNGSYALGLKLNSILGKNRVVNGGLKVTNAGARTADLTSASVAKSPAAADRLSVDQMEKMLTKSSNHLSHVEATATSSKEVEGEASMPSEACRPWSLCTTWDECAIGSLAGRPV